MTPREREIRERLAKATPGPWMQESYLSGTEYIRFQVAPSENHYGRGSLGCHISYYNIATFGMTESECDKRKYADANFIAHAPTDITYLLAQLTTAREIIEVAKGALERVIPELHRLATHHLEAKGNLSQEHKVWSHDTLLVGAGWVEKFVIEHALAKITEMEKEK